MKRICLIIDAGYLSTLRRRYNHLDLNNIRDYVELNFGPITCAYYFTSMRDGFYDAGVEAFLNYLESLEWIKLVTKGQKRQSCKKCGQEKYVERGVDVSMITAAIREAHNNTYDCLIMLNGDGDLYDGLSYIKELGKDYVPLSEPETTSGMLDTIASFHVDVLRIEEHFNKEYGYGN